MRTRNEFRRSNNSQYLDDQVYRPASPAPVEFETEERAPVSIESYVIRVGDSISRDKTLGLTSLGMGFAFVQVANNPDQLFSYLMGASYVFSMWGISKFICSNVKEDLVKTFNKNHTVRSTNWQLFSNQDEPTQEDENQKEWERYVIRVKVASGALRAYSIGEFIPHGWSFKEFKSACQNIKNSGKFSEPGSKLHKDKFSQLRESFFEYGYETQNPMIFWRDPDNKNRGVRMSSHCKVIIDEVTNIRNLKKL